MNHDPVMNDLARYEAEYDRSQKRLDAIASRAEELIDNGDLDAIVEQMTALDADRFRKSLSVICHANTRQSRDHACMEIRHLLHKAARILAEKQLNEEELSAREDAAIEAYLQRTEGIETWA